jgi:hypothetical protein
MSPGKKAALAVTAIGLSLVVAGVAGCTAAAPTSSTQPAATSRLTEAEPQESFGSEAGTVDKIATEDFDGFLGEYIDATRQLSADFPEADFPEEPPGEWNSNGNFQRGVGYMTAAFVVQCMLMTQYSDSKRYGDGALQGESLARLEDWIEIPGVQRHTDAVYQSTWLNSVIEPARTGDDSFLLALAAEC